MVILRSIIVDWRLVPTLGFITECTRFFELDTKLGCSKCICRKSLIRTRYGQGRDDSRVVLQGFLPLGGCGIRYDIDIWVPLFWTFPLVSNSPMKMCTFLAKVPQVVSKPFKVIFVFFCKNDPFTQRETNKSITICDIVLDLGNVSVDIAQIMKSTIFLINKQYQI